MHCRNSRDKYGRLSGAFFLRGVSSSPCCGRAFVGAGRRVITGSVSTPSAPLSMLRMKSGQSQRGEEISVKIKVLPELKLSPAIEENVANLAKKRSQEEKDFIEKVR